MAAELSIAINIGAAVGGAVAAIRTVLGGTRDLTATSRLLRREYRDLRQTISQMGASGGASLQRLQRAQQSLAQSANRMRRQAVRQVGYSLHLENQRNLREQMRSEVMGAAASLGVVMLPIKMAADFESSMADVRKVVDFDTPQQFQQMQQDLLDMTHRIPMAGKELSAIAAAGGQLGIARKDITSFTETIAKMSVAFDMSAEQAGESMAKLPSTIYPTAAPPKPAILLPQWVAWVVWQDNLA